MHDAHALPDLYLRSLTRRLRRTNSITISAQHLKNYTDPAKAYTEYRGVLTHETVHLYQHYGNGGTGEGLADCVRIRVGLYEADALWTQYQNDL